MGFASYLVKPIRETSLAEQLNFCLSMNHTRKMFGEGPAAPSDQPAEPAPSPNATARTGLKILLAEDNPVNALLIRELLRRRGHQIKEVATGSAAVAAMENEVFDLLLTDINLHCITGVELANKLVQRHNQLGVLYMSGDTLEGAAGPGNVQRDAHFLQKPFEASALLNKVRQLLQPSN